MSGFAINSWTLSGNLTRDPELRSTTNGTSVCTLRVAHNHRFYSKAEKDYVDQPNYFDVTLWKGMAEWAASNLVKGTRIVATGRAQWREYEANEGGKRQAVELVADSIVPSEGGGGGDSGSRSEPATDVPADGDPAPASGSDPAPARADDDIPF